jgi:uncharacterized membrane protein
MNKIRKIVLIALFCALAYVGANLKIAGSVAFDSAPAFLCAMLMGGAPGAVAGVLGHLFSALLSGFPMTLPLHLAVAAEMGLICLLTGALVKTKGWPVWLGGILALVLNAVVAPAILFVWPGFGLPVALAMFGPLLIGSAANVLLSVALAYLLKKPYGLIVEGKKAHAAV